jgi:DNA topoisomerase I
MKLVIVESPTKAKTIRKFLGKGYKVESSFGHIRDLEKKNMGIDIENNYEPKYVVPDKSLKRVTKLRALAKEAEEIILAPDEDREGEAIAWHLVKALKIDIKKSKRIVFHEVTKNAILDAMDHPRNIDMEMVNAQQARRVLDRLVGFKLSPFLWKKITFGLSAGRVQSVALRLIIEKENDIKAFNPEEYWTIDGIFNTENKDKIEAKLNKVDGKAIGKMGIKTGDKSDTILKDLKSAEYSITSITQREVKKKAPAPFTTSSLQIASNNMLGYSAKQTMMIAQKLYEGMDLGGESGGLITYMRTDSLNLSSKFLGETKDYLNKELGKEYALASPRVLKTKAKGAQEAHEAIRPTEVTRTPESIKDKLDPKQYRLYKLIWQRAVASQMPEAIMLSTGIDITTTDKKYNFRSSGQIIKFPGYLKVYPEKSKILQLPQVEKGETLTSEKINGEQHFTKPPARYNDASLVKILEEYGIGRPSTYAPTIATIEARHYAVRDEQKKLAPTEIAFTVTNLLTGHFQNIVDYKFTADMETKLDSVAEGKTEWQKIIKNFYEPFLENLQKKDKEINKKDLMPEEKTKEICEKCKYPMIIKMGRYGKFLSCSNYPECKNVKSLNADGELDKEKEKELKELRAKYATERCDKCNSDMEIKSGKFGPFLACSAYPKCKNIKSIEENSSSTGVKCPECGKGDIVKKQSKRGAFYACDQYPDCKTAFFAKPTGEKCPDCGKLLVEIKDGVKCSEKGCGYKK